MGEPKATNSQDTLPKPPALENPLIHLRPGNIPLAQQIRGVDLSHHNASVDFEKMRAGGWLFCFHKATEHTTFVDSQFRARREQMKRAGIIYGFYHFFRANRDPKAQAEHFLRTVGADIGELPPVLDWETDDSVTRAKHAGLIQIFLDTLERETGRVPIIYSGSSFAAETKLAKSFARYPLWLAHYATGSPRIPAPWTQYTFWQNSETGVVPGISGRCDTNYFNGTIAELDGAAEVRRSGRFGIIA